MPHILTCTIYSDNACTQTFVFCRQQSQCGNNTKIYGGIEIDREVTKQLLTGSQVIQILPFLVVGNNLNFKAFFFPIKDSLMNFSSSGAPIPSLPPPTHPPPQINVIYNFKLLIRYSILNVVFWGISCGSEKWGGGCKYLYNL